MTNPLLEVQSFGQSIWYDNIRRGLITEGLLQTLIHEDGLRGITSNPSIFEKAIAGSADYDPAARALIRQGVGSAQEIYEALAIDDIKLAADVMYPVYTRTETRDGYVSFEVSPYLSNDTQGTIEEARRHWKTIGRDNVMIKVPATPEGIPAVRALIGDGINVNVTLLFSVDAYRKVADAYMGGLEDLIKRGGDPKHVSSVASFFVSRIDSHVDAVIGRELDATTDSARRDKLKSLIGRTAIANAVIAYAAYLEIIASPRWKKLADAGAITQRLLWASTGTKNPKYAKTIYVDNLIAPDTVNTVPEATYTAFRAEGKAAAALMGNWDKTYADARTMLQALESSKISLKDATDSLLTAGVKLFSDAFDQLLAAVEKKRQKVLTAEFAEQTWSLGKDADAAVAKTIDEWRASGKVRRLWRHDASLWTGGDEAEWMGWMHVVDGQLEHPEQIDELSRIVRESNCRHVLLLGMGGSSLCPEVLKKTFGALPGAPELLVLDSTVPAQVARFAKMIDPAKTLFIVASKSGSTTEPNVFKQFFMELAQKAGGNAPARFIAITDPGTKMHKLAKQESFRHIAYGVPSIGGRYSALSNFGVVPAIAMGLDVKKLLHSSEIMVHACGPAVPPEANPGIALGVVMGTMALRGQNKLTLIASPAIESLGSWLEQLLAESTGKDGKGIVPVALEPIGAPEVYGDDRLFVYVRLDAAPDRAQDSAVDALEKAGKPVVRIRLDDRFEIGQEFFRWEIATAVAGAVIGIHPFNQPDVEAAKIATRSLTEAYEKTGTLPAEKPALKVESMAFFADSGLNGSAASAKDAVTLLREHFKRIKPGDYFAVNAYVDMNDANDAEIALLRLAVRDKKRVATTVGYGPRFLHSTGQLHKGGPNSGVFLQITSDDAADLAIPGQKFTFGVLKQFQALGDFGVLCDRKRRILRVHLGADVAAGLRKLRAAVDQALA